MQRSILLFAFFFTASSSFLACKDVEREGEEVEIMSVEETTGTDRYEKENMNTNFATFDANQDTMLDKTEFIDSNITAFSQWDEDGDSSLNSEEFYRSTFAMADVNNDDVLDENEWNEGLNTLYSDYAGENDWDAFDTNQDGFLSSDEWSEGFSDSDWFDVYDQDDNGILDNNEWSSGIFEGRDTNKDSFLDSNEYNNYNPNF